MRYIIAAPGLPEGDTDYPEVKPYGCINEDIIKHAVLVEMEVREGKCVIKMAPVDFLRLHHIQSWADVVMDRSLDNGKTSEVVINDVIRIMGISVKSKPVQSF